ncbi:MAG TPA: glycosyltransferase [Vicinamibacterales bacterium]
MLIIDSLHIGGAENAVALIARGLHRERFDVAVRCTASLGVIAEQLLADGIDVALSGAPTRRQRYFTPWYLHRAIKDWGADVVHSHGTPSLLHLGPLAALGATPPWVHTFHYGNYPLPNRKEMLGERVFVREASQLVAVAEVQRQSIIRCHRINPNAIVTVVNGVDASRVVGPDVREARRAEFGFTPAHIVVGCVAVLTRQKGITYLLQAARELVDRDPRIRFLVAGGGPLEAALRQEAIDLGLGDRVVFTGWRQDNFELLSALDVFVMSSLWEAMPLALLEAMSASRPIVVTDVGDNRMVVGDGEAGIVIPPADPPAIVSAVLQHIGDPDGARAMAERARQRFLQRFTTEQMVRRYEDIYERVASGARTPSLHGYAAGAVQ